MRIVLYVHTEIPGLAPADSYLSIRATDEKWPIMVTTSHRPEALKVLAEHLSCVEVEDLDEVSEEARQILWTLLAPDASGTRKPGKPILRVLGDG